MGQSGLVDRTGPDRTVGQSRESRESRRGRYLNVEQMHQVAALVHVLLQVALHELEHERQRVGRVDDVMQRHDVRVLQPAQQRH